MSSQNIFDEQAKEAADWLLESFWILREDDPERFRMIREREQALTVYFREKFGYRLIVHRHFAKLEKIPASPEAWMGIQKFTDQRDYALFCCLLAFLETKSVDDQFLLSDCCEELKSIYPDELDWTHYEHRKSLVRVMQFATELQLVLTVDGDIEQFRYAESSEVLYEVPVYSRYFMRTYPKDLFQYSSLKELLEAEYTDNSDEQTGMRRRHRVYRQLFLTPAMLRTSDDDVDFLYLRTYRNRIREDIERHTSYQFELYRHTAMLTQTERNHRSHLYPDQRAISDISLQFAEQLRAEVMSGQVTVGSRDKILMSMYELEQRVQACKEKYGAGWSKQYRSDQSVQATVTELLNLWREWKMAEVDEETGMVMLYPHLVRTTGRYPRDFILDGDVEDDEHEDE